MVKSSLGGEVYALSEMVDHTMSLKDCYGPLVGLGPGMVGLEACESPFTYLKTKKMVAEKYFVQHFLGIQQAPKEGELGNIYWLPRLKHPTDGPTTVRSYMDPLSRLRESEVWIRGPCEPSKE